jgi:hypothetical protein
VEVQGKLEEIIAVVEGARAMPMSASCIVNRGDLLKSLDELRQLLPAELADATTLLRERDDVVDGGRREAERLVAAAHDEAARLVSETEVMRQAAEESEQVRLAAEQQAASMRAEVDDYVDAKLANFEIVLNKTLAAVLRGREKLSGRRAVEELGDGAESDEEPAELPGEGSPEG